MYQQELQARNKLFTHTVMWESEKTPPAKNSHTRLVIKRVVHKVFGRDDSSKKVGHEFDGAH